MKRTCGFEKQQVNNMKSLYNQPILLPWLSSGCAGILVGHPFDTVKVRLQTQCSTNPFYRGTFHCFSHTIKQETVVGLYKGLTSPLGGFALINAITFGVQGNVRRRMRNPDTVMAHTISGSIAGCAQSVVCSPMELARTRMQLQGHGTTLPPQALQYKSPLDCLGQVYKSEGFRGVFRGLGTTVAREAPSFAVYFASYEMLKKTLSRGKSDPGTMVLLTAGGLTGMVTWLSTYPIDVIKSRIQADQTNKYKGFLDCAKKSYAEAGPRAFTKGLGPTLLRAFPTNAATFLAYEFVLQQFMHRPILQTA